MQCPVDNEFSYSIYLNFSSRFLLEKIIASLASKNFPRFFGIKRFIVVYQRAVKY
jgi:hypothetical protein